MKETSDEVRLCTIHVTKLLSAEVVARPRVCFTTFFFFCFQSVSSGYFLSLFSFSFLTPSFRCKYLKIVPEFV